MEESRSVGGLSEAERSRLPSRSEGRRSVGLDGGGEDLESLRSTADLEKKEREVEREEASQHRNVFESRENEKQTVVLTAFASPEQGTLQLMLEARVLRTRVEEQSEREEGSELERENEASNSELAIEYSQHSRPHSTPAMLNPAFPQKSVQSLKVI